MEGFGLPKLWNAIPMLKAIDLCYNVLYSDLDKAEKILLVPVIQPDITGHSPVCGCLLQLPAVLGVKLVTRKKCVDCFRLFPGPRIDLQYLTQVRIVGATALREITVHAG